MTRVRVVFTPAGRRGEVESGTTVLDAARHLGVDLDSVCGGRGICGHCQVVPAVGTHAKWAITTDAAALGPVTDAEAGARPARPVATGHRLGCLATLTADAVVDVPAASQVHRPVVRKAVTLEGLVIDPTVTLAYVELPAPEAAGPSLATALCRAIAAAHGITVDAVAPGALAGIGAIGSGSRTLTAALRHDADGVTVAAGFPGFTDRLSGIAVDVGSTTVAGHLCDLATGEVLASAGAMNPQIRFGEDVMSRVSYVMLNPGGAGELTRAVRHTIADLVVGLCAAAGTATDRVLDVVLVGNPVMHHLLLGLDPTPLGTAPFELVTDAAVRTDATALDLPLPHAAVYCAPCISGHVGADTAAAMVSERTASAAAPQLLVDIGTNAEIVLGTPAGVWAASSPTGPAFEGAQLSCGQRATAGAIEAVRVDPHTLATTVRVIGCEHWSDTEAFAAARPTVTGICGSGIVDAIAQLYLAGVVDADGTIRADAADRTDRAVPDGRTTAFVLYADGSTRVVLTQNDVRAIQLAKAALRAGIDLVLEHAGVEAVGDVRLAGAFGAHLDPVHATVLGLVPDAPAGTVRSVGNAAGAGAVRLLLSATERRDVERAVRSVIRVETATEPRFQDRFVAAMAIPHADAPTPYLATAVALPQRVPDRPRRRTRRSTHEQ